MNKNAPRRPRLGKTKPFIENIDGTPFVILTDKGRYQKTRRQWPTDIRVMDLYEFQIRFTLDEIHDAVFTRRPKGRGYDLTVSTVKFGNETYHIAENPADIQKIVNFGLNIKN